MSLLPLVEIRGMNAQPIPLKPGEEPLMIPTGHSRKFAGRTLLIIFAIVAIVSAVYLIAIRTDVGRRRLETEQPPKQPDLVSQIRIIGFLSRFEDSRSAWAAFTIVNDNPFPITDIILRCDFQGANEVHVHMRGPVVPAKGQKAFDEFLRFVSSDTRNSNCAVVDAHRQY